MHVKKGDTVMVNAGSDKGVKGEVLKAIPSENKVVVKGVNVRKKHMKPRKQGEAGGIIDVEVAIPASRVNLYCSKCGKTYPEDYIFENKDSIPKCSCGGTIRPDITLYEEGLPEDAVRGAISAIASADMLIIGGTSLTVYPAASYIDYLRGKYLVIINQSPLNIKTDSNTLVVSERIGDFFRQVAKEEGVEL